MTDNVHNVAGIHRCERHDGLVQSPCSPCTCPPPVAEPPSHDAAAGLVEVLAKALREAGVEIGYVGGEAFRARVAAHLADVITREWLPTQLSVAEGQRDILHAGIHRLAKAGCGATSAELWNLIRSDR